MATGFHAGELAAQRSAGVAAAGARMARTIRSSMPTPLIGFLADQSWIHLSGADAAQRIWASTLLGDAGLIEVVDDTTLHLPYPAADDPLRDLDAESEVGLLAIDLTRRRRARINGTVHPDTDGIRVHVDQCYANCPKYIQSRPHRPAVGTDPVVPTTRTDTAHLTEADIELLDRADTAVLATIAPGFGADCSHRGGMPGFLQCSPDGTVIRFDDHPGNAMFNSLGNLELDDRAGLTVPDFDTGALLQITGRATVRYATPDERTVEITVGHVVHRTGVLPWRYGPVEYSPASIAVTSDH